MGKIWEFSKGYMPEIKQLNSKPSKKYIKHKWKMIRKEFQMIFSQQPNEINMKKCDELYKNMSGLDHGLIMWKKKQIEMWKDGIL